jgi:5-methylcytosine-specific restriction enzyme A
VYIFTREDDRAPFTYEGGHPLQVSGNRPVKIVWELESRAHLAPPGEVTDGEVLREGATRVVTVTLRERRPHARRHCIAHYGCCCAVCGIDLSIAYGALAKGFIHVHHLNPIGDAEGERDVNPVEDLRPVCPTCHSVIHLNNPPLKIEDLKEMLATTGWLKIVEQFNQRAV